MLAGDVEAADALAEFDFVIGEESEGSESDVTVVEVNDDSRDAVEDDINIRASTEGKPEIPADDVNMPDAENKVRHLKSCRHTTARVYARVCVGARMLAGSCAIVCVCARVTA